jgi:hypothetical protein
MARNNSNEMKRERLIVKAYSHLGMGSTFIFTGVMAMVGVTLKPVGYLIVGAIVCFIGANHLREMRRLNAEDKA